MIIHNKGKLIAKKYTKEFGVNFEESYTFVAILEAIRILLAFVCARNIDIEYHKCPDHVFRLHKTLYGLKQAPKSWYDKLNLFLLERNFKRGMVDIIFFIKIVNSHMIIL